MTPVPKTKDYKEQKQSNVNCQKKSTSPNVLYEDIQRTKQRWRYNNIEVKK